MARPDPKRSLRRRLRTRDHSRSNKFQTLCGRSPGTSVAARNCSRSPSVFKCRTTGSEARGRRSNAGIDDQTSLGVHAAALREAIGICSARYEPSRTVVNRRCAYPHRTRRHMYSVSPTRGGRATPTISPFSGSDPLRFTAASLPRPRSSDQQPRRRSCYASRHVPGVRPIPRFLHVSRS